jgi:hypothetical protein
MHQTHYNQPPRKEVRVDHGHTAINFWTIADAPA